MHDTRRAARTLDRVANALAVLGLLVFLSGLVSASGASQDSRSPLDHTEGMAAAPTWVSGETWRLQVTDAYSVQPYEVHVTAGGGNAKTLGVRLADLQTPILVDRMVPLGPITGFSYEVDDAIFNLLDFPLATGKTWTTAFGSEQLVAHVDSVTAGIATLTYAHPGSIVPSMTVVYDPVLGFPISVERHGVGSFEVLGHDAGSSCNSVAPSKIDVAFNEGQSQVGLTPRAQPPIQDLTVADGYDRIAIALFASGTPGLQRAVLHAPDGAQYTSDPVVAALGDFHAHFDLAQPSGVWRLERESIGSGFAQATGLAYSLEPLDNSCTAPSIRGATAMSGPSSPIGQLMRWLIAAALEAAAFAVRFRRAIRTWLPSLFVLPLFARLSRERVLQHPTRQKILAVVQEKPGLSTQEIRRRCGHAWAETRYHLELLLSHGVLESVRWGRNRNWFVADSEGLDAQRRAAALNRPGTKALFDAIRSAPGSSPAELARNLKVHHSTIAYHLLWLERADLVRRKQVGRSARCYPA